MYYYENNNYNTAILITKSPLYCSISFLITEIASFKDLIATSLSVWVVTTT